MRLIAKTLMRPLTAKMQRDKVRSLFTRTLAWYESILDEVRARSILKRGDQDTATYSEITYDTTSIPCDRRAPLGAVDDHRQQSDKRRGAGTDPSPGCDRWISLEPLTRTRQQDCVSGSERLGRETDDGRRQCILDDTLVNDETQSRSECIIIPRVSKG